MPKPKRKIVYKAKYTGNVYTNQREAIADNKMYLSSPRYRFIVKSGNIEKPKRYDIPFIKNKRITLSNAGLATGAVLSTNLLDTIAKYADQAKLPIKTAIGLATKESTLGNPTDDSSIYKILSKEKAKWFKEQGTGQHINKGISINPNDLVNFHRDFDNPYMEAIKYSSIHNTSLEGGEAYADKKAKEYVEQYGKNNTLYNAFKFYKEHPDMYNPGQPNYQQLVNKRAEEVWNSPEVQTWYRRSLEDGRVKKSSGGSIHIAPSKRDTFTAAATKHHMGVQEFASTVLKNKDRYSPAMVKKANFARNASKWNH